MKKRIDKKHFTLITRITSIIVLLVILLSIGWSSYNSTMAIDSKSIVRVFEEVRVTGFSIHEVNNGALGTYEEYGADFVTADVTLPNANSTITYEVEVTNLQLPNGVSTGILNVYGLPEGLNILSWNGYTLRDKICDTSDPSDCGPGSQMTFYITLGYTNSSYFDSNNTNLRFDINFDFREFHDITYYNIVGNYPTEILDGDDLTLSLGNISSLELEVYGTNQYIEGNNYTFNNGVLVVGSVHEDLTITKSTSYVITYDANGGYFDGNPSITTNSVTYLWKNNQNHVVAGTEKIPVNGTQSLYNWYTDNVNYTTVFDKSVAITQDRTVYAKWVNKVAEINGTLYDSLHEAVAAVSANDVLVNIRLLRSTSDNVTVASHKNIVIDLQGYTLTNDAADAIFTNSGTLKLKNGTLNSASINTAVINTSSPGELTLENVNVNMTNSSGKQALYGNGIIKITGTSHLTSNSRNRGTIQITSGGVATITGGIVEALGTKSAIVNAGTLTVGIKDGNIDTDSVLISGMDLGVDGNLNFYDGTIRGKNNAVTSIIDNILDKEPNIGVFSSQVVVNGVTYKAINLSSTFTVTFDPNGGVMSDTTRYVSLNDPVGALPAASYAGYVLVGWFTDPSNGTQIDANYIITQDEYFYAHWTRSYSAEMNGTYYYTLQDAISAASNNTRTVVNLLRDASECANITSGKNIYLDLNSYTLSFTGSQAVIDNYGTLEVVNGTITTESNANAAINTRQKGNSIIDSVNIISVGSRQAVYNYSNATTLIKGNSYISSRTTGTPSGSNMERGTVHNLANATLTITGGTIVGINQQAVSNEGTLIIGIKQDGVIDNTNLVIRGETYGIKSSTPFKWYDGLIKGINGPVSGNISEEEDNTTVMYGTEIIDNKTYSTQYLQSMQ